MKYYLSVTAILKNEAYYLEEWLEFHILQGVQHFFLFLNEDINTHTDEVDILNRYQRLGLVTWGYWPGNGTQFTAYNESLTRFGSETRWMAFIDIDEFLLGTSNPLASELTFYEAHPAVAVHWIHFGSAGQLYKTPGLVIERFIMREPGTNEHVKSIVQPDKTVSLGSNAHYFILNGHAVDEMYKGLPEYYAQDFDGSTSVLRVHHYAVKSREESDLRWINPRIDTNEVRPNQDTHFKERDTNDTQDLTAYKFINSVKTNIKRRSLC